MSEEPKIDHVFELMSIANEIDNPTDDDGSEDFWRRMSRSIRAAAAEMERLKPPEMTLQEAFEVIRSRKHRGDRRWQIEGDTIYLEAQKHSLYGIEAVYIAQGLLRDNHHEPKTASTESKL